MSRVVQHSSTTCDVAVIGAGASGLACALECARTLRSEGRHDAHIFVLESSSKPGRSILASGNGRCNFSNQQLASSSDRRMYHNASFVEQSAKALRDSSAGVLSWFRSLGLVWRAADDSGLLYPYSDKASSVLDVLLAACKRWGVTVVPEFRAQAVVRIGTGFSIQGERGIEQERTKTARGRIKRTLIWEPAEFKAGKVVVAVGGSVAKDLVPGHVVHPLSGVLAPLATEMEAIRGLSGVRAHVRARLMRDGRLLFEEEGEVLFRDYGVSGIVSFNASRHAHPGDVLELDLAPDYDLHSLIDLLMFLAHSLEATSADELLGGMFVPEFANCIIGKAQLSAAKPDEEAIIKLASAIKCFSLAVDGVYEDGVPQVSRGGCDVGEVNPSTLESKLTDGLFVLGEALDVDGPCGGYNLDWAWTCGILAGKAIARTLR